MTMVKLAYRDAMDVQKGLNEVGGMDCKDGPTSYALEINIVKLAPLMRSWDKMTKALVKDFSHQDEKEKHSIRFNDANAKLAYEELIDVKLDELVDTVEFRSLPRAVLIEMKVKPITMALLHSIIEPKDEK